MPKFMDLTGMKFNRLTVISKAERTYDKTRWNCICDCGRKTCTITNALTSGRTRSCGCIGEGRKTHGMAGTHIYQIWSAMRKRCSNPNDKRYDRYGGRGIRVCEEWDTSFEPFYKWSKENGYKDGLSIDRIDNDGPYSPDNCRWITMSEQSKNKSGNVKIIHKGETKTLSEWCLQYNFPFGTADQRYNRLKKAGKDITLEKLFYRGNKSIKRVNQYSLDGVLIKTWDKMTDVKKEGFYYPKISDCCRGKREQAYGFIWKYAQESD